MNLEEGITSGDYKTIQGCFKAIIYYENPVRIQSHSKNQPTRRNYVIP